MLENFTCVGEKRFTFCTCGYPQSQKDATHPPKNHQQLSVKLPKIS